MISETGFVITTSNDEGDIVFFRGCSRGSSFSDRWSKDIRSAQIYRGLKSAESALKISNKIDKCTKSEAIIRKVILHVLPDWQRPDNKLVDIFPL